MVGKEELLLVIAPMILSDARKLGRDINLRADRAPEFSDENEALLITGTVDGCVVVGYVRGNEHALWFADSIV